jgi:hypothetical protein
VKGERETLEPPVGVPTAARTGAARGRSRTRRERLHPLLPLLPRRRVAAFLFFLLAGKPHHHTTPTHCTSASGHRGEDNRCSPLVVAPAIEPRRNARCSAPPLLMPAFVPGWDETSCRCRCLRQRVLLPWPSFPVSSCSSCDAFRDRDTAPSRSCSRSR